MFCVARHITCSLKKSIVNVQFNRLFNSSFVNNKHFLEKVDLKSSTGDKVDFVALKKKVK